ncbi:hypothetical protein TNCV_4549571 [Trichonephila clavipes]|nr:hypothetical protein TNCV_4549571 [Trichonephila clavipes]
MEARSQCWREVEVWGDNTIIALWLSPPNDPFPVTELVTSQRQRSFAWESIPVWRIRRSCSKASQPLTSLCPADSDVTPAVPTPISSFKVHRTRGDKDQCPNSIPGYVQTDADSASGEAWKGVMFSIFKET